MPPQLNTVDSNTVHKSVSGNKLHSFQQGLTELMIIKAAIHSTAAMDVVLKDQNVSKPLHISGTCPGAEVTPNLFFTSLSINKYMKPVVLTTYNVKLS